MDIWLSLCNAVVYGTLLVLLGLVVQEVDAISLDGGRSILLEQILSEAVRDVSLLSWRLLLQVEFIRVEYWDRIIAVGRRCA